MSSERAELEAELERQLEALGSALPESRRSLLACSSEQRRQLIEYIQLLERWTGSIDLVSQKSGRSMVQPHIIDSIAGYCMAIDQQAAFVDVGSGAGLPGIVWGILNPELEGLLLEPRQKRVDFLSEVRRRLGLKQLHVLAGRSDTVTQALLPDAASLCLVCRALGSEAEYLRFARSQAEARESCEALILAGPSWNKAAELPEVDAVIDYQLSPQGPARKLIRWQLS